MLCHSCPPIFAIVLATRKPAATLSFENVAFGTINVPVVAPLVFAVAAFGQLNTTLSQTMSSSEFACVVCCLPSTTNVYWPKETSVSGIFNTTVCPSLILMV